jgi:hypothetical protein
MVHHIAEYALMLNGAGLELTAVEEAGAPPCRVAGPPIDAVDAKTEREQDLKDDHERPHQIPLHV